MTRDERIDEAGNIARQASMDYAICLMNWGVVRTPENAATEMSARKDFITALARLVALAKDVN